MPKARKSKWKRGRPIRSVDELLKQDTIVFSSGDFQKVYVHDWFVGWRLVVAESYIRRRYLYKAVPAKPKEPAQC